jgi:monomeric isocitrate dehydrogenase
MLFTTGITNLHVPSDVIVDASMPCVVRDSGKMWNRDNALEDVKCVIPDRCYATMYQEIISFVKQHGQVNNDAFEVTICHDRQARVICVRG